MTPSTARRLDTIRSGAARAHRDSVGTLPQQRVAELYGSTDRAQRRWMDSGPPAAVAFDRFLIASPDRFRWEAHVRVTTKMLALDKLTDSQLIERIRELRERQADLEAEGRKLDVRGASLGERAVLAERLSAVTAELSASLVIAAERCEQGRMTEEEVLP